MLARAMVRENGDNGAVLPHYYFLRADGKVDRVIPPQTQLGTWATKTMEPPEGTTWTAGSSAAGRDKHERSTVEAVAHAAEVTARRVRRQHRRRAKKMRKLERLADRMALHLERGGWCPTTPEQK